MSNNTTLQIAQVFTVESNQQSTNSEQGLASKNPVATKNIGTIINLFKTSGKKLKNYLKKFYGLHEERPKRIEWFEYIWSFIGSFISIAVIAFLHFRLLEERDLIILIGSFGASAVIVFATPRSPFGQPRNLIGGHLIGSTCGCLMRLAIEPHESSIATSIAVALSIIIMQFTETLHPPGGATALIAVTLKTELPWKNFVFILIPALSGAFAMLVIALVVNNMASNRTYPTFWW